MLFRSVCMPASARADTGARPLHTGANFASDVLPTNEAQPRGVTGACCIGTTCVTTDAAGCTTLGGDYQGDGTDCAPVVCPAPVGPCCFDGGRCPLLIHAHRTIAGGNSAGARVYEGCKSATIQRGRNPESKLTSIS